MAVQTRRRRRRCARCGSAWGAHTQSPFPGAVRCLSCHMGRFAALSACDLPTGVIDVYKAHEVRL